jgi:hypothetical protein
MNLLSAASGFARRPQPKMKGRLLRIQRIVFRPAPFFSPPQFFAKVAKSFTTAKNKKPEVFYGPKAL